MSKMDISGPEMERVASLGTTKTCMDASVMTMHCPKCGASAGRKCRRADGNVMTNRAHSERNQKLFHAEQANANELVRGFVDAGRANGDAVTVMFIGNPVKVDGIEGTMIAKSVDLGLDLTSALLRLPHGNHTVVQATSEKIRIVR